MCPGQGSLARMDPEMSRGGYLGEIRVPRLTVAKLQSEKKVALHELKLCNEAFARSELRILELLDSLRAALEIIDRMHQNHVRRTDPLIGIDDIKRLERIRNQFKGEKG